jgi:hypothetical protein
MRSLTSSRSFRDLVCSRRPCESQSEERLGSLNKPYPINPKTQFQPIKMGDVAVSDWGDKRFTFKLCIPGGRISMILAVKIGNVGSTVKDIAMDKIFNGPSQARVRQIDEDSECATEACSS